MKDLSKAIRKRAPDAVKQTEVKAYTGRKIAIDANINLYQFSIGIHQDGMSLHDDYGIPTSHLSGMFYRTIGFMEVGIKPVYVFAGTPPKMKDSVLDKREEGRAKAKTELSDAKEIGDFKAMQKWRDRANKVTAEQIAEAKQLLKLLGVPYIQAPCQAEAQCAELVKAGKVFATASENMDALIYGTNMLLRQFSFKDAGKKPVREYNLQKVLRDMNFTKEQFIDYCILIGCDYCPKIRDIGVQIAFDLISKHKSIEEVIKALDPKTYTVPENWQFAAARDLFLNPEVIKGGELKLKWKTPDEEGLLKFLCHEKGFNEKRVKEALKKIPDTKAPVQVRIEDFFKSNGVKSSVPSSLKRKAMEEEKKVPAKKAKKSFSKSK